MDGKITVAQRYAPFLLLFCLLDVFPGFTQTYQKRYTCPPNTVFLPQDLLTDSQQNSYLTGEISNGTPRTFLQKNTPTGQPLWCRTFSPTNPASRFPLGMSVKLTSDNGLVFSTTQETTTDTEGGILIKTDTAGALQWAKIAPCAWRKSRVCTAQNRIFYASNSHGVKKVLLGCLDNNGNVLWEKQLEAGDSDFYYVESLVTASNGDIILSLRVSRFETGGTQILPENGILFRLNPDGVVQKVAFFDKLILTALVPLSNGRIAFGCTPSLISWTGVGVMDLDFKWTWFRKCRFDHDILLPFQVSPYLTVTADESRIWSLLQAPGGEKIALAFDPAGNPLQQQLYFSGNQAEIAAAVDASGYLRSSGVTKDAFLLTRPDLDGNLPNCTLLAPCGLILEAAFFPAGPVAWAETPVSCLQPVTVQTDTRQVLATDYCFDPGPSDAAFDMTDTLLCPGEYIAVKRQAGLDDLLFGSSSWTFEGGLPGQGATPSLDRVVYLQPGYFTVTHAFTVAGCVDTARQLVHVLSAPESLLGPDTLLCAGAPLTLRASDAPGVSVNWNTGAQGSDIEINMTGKYRVTLTDPGGCSSVDSISVQFIAPQNVTLGPDTALCAGGRLSLQPQIPAPGQQFQWNTGDTTAFLLVTQPGMYSIQSGLPGCLFTDTIVVREKICNGCSIYVPNVFTPHTNTDNNRFSAFSGCPVQQFYLQIYDRWGNLRFRTTDPAIGWDGQDAQPGVYVYFIEIQLLPENGVPENKRLTGTVTVIP